ncbi:hypothetical protein CP8484711_1326B, partial [Chlamydia psittaci 84-8471/1]
KFGKCFQINRGPRYALHRLIT